MTDLSAEEVRAMLDLAPHPEGGHFRQTWIAGAEGDARPAGTCIYFLLAAGERSHWHRVDAAEIWHHYAGAPLDLWISPDDAGPARLHRLGPDLGAGQRPQAIVPPMHWQAAESRGAWSLVGCTVSPAFRFDGFELAAPEFDIPRG